MKSSETEKEQKREMANSGAIDAFGVNLGGSVTQMSELICVTLALRGIRRFERRTITKSRSRFVAVSRCSILTPTGLTWGSALRSLMFPSGNRLLVIENEFSEVPIIP